MRPVKDRIRVQVLLIDDEAIVCRRVAAWLDAEGYEVATFTDPQAGIAYAQQTPCDLALVDLRLPNLDGTEVIARLRELSPQTRILALGTFPDAEQVRRALAAGARDLVEKPLQPRVLLAALERELAEIGVVARREWQFNRRLGRRVRSLREQSGRTQHEVAQAAGITAAQLSQIELGKTATSTWTLARVCAVLRVPLAEVFRGL